MIQVKAPGKLYIAGEYAVTEPGYKSVLIAVNRFVTASIEASGDNGGSIHSKTLHHEPITFHREGDKISVSDADAAKQLAYVITAVEVFEQYAKSCGKSLKHFNLVIDSNLDDASGHKYGLGSSAAVLVSVVKALNEFYEFLGLEKTDYGELLGWAPLDEGMYWIEFNHRKLIMEDGLQCYILEMPFDPREEYLDLY